MPCGLSFLRAVMTQLVSPALSYPPTVTCRAKTTSPKPSEIGLTMETEGRELGLSCRGRMTPTQLLVPPCRPLLHTVACVAHGKGQKW